ncbi:MAG: hypothetical protein J1D99_00355 [Campylobacter sp.]|nr:hypothetical protein [Campylobacter sp.]
MSKDLEKNERVKYLRKLEKFARSAYVILKKEDFDLNKFKERMLKNYQNLDKNFRVNLNSNYAKALEDFVKACLDFSKEKEELLNLANSLDKQKNRAKKKEKYKNYLKDYE